MVVKSDKEQVEPVVFLVSSSSGSEEGLECVSGGHVKKAFFRATFGVGCGGVGTGDRLWREL